MDGNMKLRKLKIKDALLMLEWMHDEIVTMHLKTDFRNKTEDDCVSFISSSLSDKKNIHMAITDDNDEYMGTVSLKNINYTDSFAEFAITVRRTAMGKNFASFGMNEIIRIAHEDLNIKRVIWCVSTNNHRAIKFYRKLGYIQISDVPEELLKKYSEQMDLIWFEG